MTGVEITLGGVQVDDADFAWPLYTGSAISPVVITIDAFRSGEFELLPYITTLNITASGEDGTNSPTLIPLAIEGVRIIEIRKLNDVAAEVYLGDVRVDLARRVFPSDFMMRWRDGYLDGTNKPTFQQAVEFVASLVPELQDALANDAFAEVGGTEYSLPDGILKSGLLLLPALEEMASTVGTTISVGFDGKIRFPKADSSSTVPIDAYSWVDDMRPTWEVLSRVKRGLPKTIRCYYPERHQLILELADPRSTDSTFAHTVEFEWVYGFGEGYGSLSELLTYYGFGSSSLSEAEIADKINTANFEGTAIERDGSAEADDIITVIKRDWRKVARIVYPSSFGRRGGWSDLVPGRLKQVTDKDGKTRWAPDPESSPVEAEWVQWYDTPVPPAGGSTWTLYGAMVARGHRTNETDIPFAPFNVDFVPGQDDILRFTYNQQEENTAAAWIGRIASSDFLRITRAGSEDDTGNHVEHSFDMYIPELSDLRFREAFDMRVYIVATRQTPNTYERWTAIDVAGFPDGDVDVQELEVGPELHALYEVLAIDTGAPPLNRAELEEDAERRARIMKEDMAARLEGVGVAQGVEFVQDYVYPHGPVNMMSIEVDDSTVVFTRVVVGNRDSAQARWDRSQKRRASKRREVGGVEIV